MAVVPARFTKRREIEPFLANSLDLIALKVADSAFHKPGQIVSIFALNLADLVPI